MLLVRWGLILKHSLKRPEKFRSYLYKSIGLSTIYRACKVSVSALLC